MNTTKHLAQAIEEFTLIHQQLPTVLRCTWDVRLELERHKVELDGMQYEMVKDSAYPVLVVR